MLDAAVVVVIVVVVVASVAAVAPDSPELNRTSSPFPTIILWSNSPTFYEHICANIIEPK